MRFLRLAKSCPFCTLKTSPDYKLPNILMKYLDNKFRIKNREKTHLCPSHQRKLANQIAIAREMALLPYISHHGTSR